MGEPNATAEEIRHAAEPADADGFIRALPNGYDSMVGERGVRLSGGQRQRINIARVILKDAPILMLDEATSALDNISERRIFDSLREHRRGRMTIVVAHRFSTVRDAEHIVVLADGAVAEDGTHTTLLAKGGLYTTLYNNRMLAPCEKQAV